MEVAAKMLLPDDTICAECQAVVIKPAGEISKCWEDEKKHWYVEQENDSISGWAWFSNKPDPSFSHPASKYL